MFGLVNLFMRITLFLQVVGFLGRQLVTRKAVQLFPLGAG